MFGARRYSVIAGIVFSFLQTIQAQQSQPSEPPKFDFDVEHDLIVEIKQRPETVSSFFFASVNGPAVRVGSKVRFRLRIKNLEKEPFEFDKIQLGCRCLSIYLSKNRIEPGEFITGVADYIVDSEPNPKYSLNILFGKAEKTVGDIRITGLLENVLAILSRPVYECEGAIGVWEIPILCTSPADRANLKASLSDSLRDVGISIGKNAEGPIVVLECPASTLGLTGIAGHLTVEETQQKIKTSAAITLIKRPPVRISPLAARFVRKSGEKEFQAMVLINALNSSPKPNENENQKVRSTSKDQQSVNRILNIKCACEEKEMQLRVETISINESLKRVKLFAAIEKKDIEEVELTWTIETSEGSFSVKGIGCFLENLP